MILSFSFPLSLIIPVSLNYMSIRNTLGNGCIFQSRYKCMDNLKDEETYLLYPKKKKTHVLYILILWLQSLKKLRILDVSNSIFLTETGDFTGLENLEELYFGGCKYLNELHSSIVCLHKLAILDLTFCMPLKTISWEIIGKLPSLQELKLGNNFYTGFKPDELIDPFLSSLEEYPITKLTLNSLLQLNVLNRIELVRCESIQSIPNLPLNITYIKAYGCTSLVNLPLNMSELKSLTVVDFHFCPKLGSEDPQFLMKLTGLTNLHHLSIRVCSVSQVPSEIGNLVSLIEVNLSENTFSSLPDSCHNLLKLVYLNLSECSQLRFLPLLPPNLTDIEAYGCWSLDLKSCASMQTKYKVWKVCNPSLANFVMNCFLHVLYMQRACNTYLN